MEIDFGTHRQNNHLAVSILYNSSEILYNPRIRPNFWKKVVNLNGHFWFFFGFQVIFRPRNINLRVRILILVPSVFDFVQFSTISWPSKFPSYARGPPSGTVGFWHHNKIDVARSIFQDRSTIENSKTLKKSNQHLRNPEKRSNSENRVIRKFRW